MLDNTDNDLSLSTLTGDIRDVMLGHIRQRPKPWQQMTGEEQREIVNSVTMASNNLVRQVVQMFTAYDFPRAVVTLGDMKIKADKKIEAKITCANIENYRETLGEHVGDSVMILMVDSERFMGARGEIRFNVDEPPLPLEDDDDWPDTDADAPEGDTAEASPDTEGDFADTEGDDDRPDELEGMQPAPTQLGFEPDGELFPDQPDFPDAEAEEVPDEDKAEPAGEADPLSLRDQDDDGDLNDDDEPGYGSEEA